jgi:hypothetical protein
LSLFEHRAPTPTRPGCFFYFSNGSCLARFITTIMTFNLLICTFPRLRSLKYVSGVVKVWYCYLPTAALLTVSQYYKKEALSAPL